MLSPANYISGQACDHYHRYEEDFDWIKSLHQNVHRLSIEWSRIEPTEGKFDKKELQHYRRVAEALKTRGIEPFITLKHFTNPVWPAEKGGVTSSDYPRLFTRYVQKVVQEYLSKISVPVVIDADAINVIASNQKFKQMLKGRLLTPHTGEFSRLSGKSINELQSDPVRFVKEFAEKYECSILLKSATTLFSDGREIVFNISGNDGLSTGGSGDVLAGIIISFLGQKLDLKDAAISASYLLGATAENLAEIRKPASIIPTEIIEELFKY